MKNKLPLFHCFCLENFPFIEAQIQALSVYELLCKVIEYLNKTIDKTNELSKQVEALTNWFNNLDVQDEINNKLDQMAEDGTLQEIIESYIKLKSLLVYDTVDDMIGATNLVEGSYCMTYGFHSLNDGGGAHYKVRQIVNTDVTNTSTLFPITSNPDLVAELIEINNLNPQMFGAKGDGVTDDTQALQNYIDYCYDNMIYEVNFDKTYFVQKHGVVTYYGNAILSLHSNTHYNGGNFKTNSVPVQNDSDISLVFSIINSQHITISNVLLEVNDLNQAPSIYVKNNVDPEGATESNVHFVTISNSNYITVEDNITYNAWGVGIYNHSDTININNNQFINTPLPFVGGFSNNITISNNKVSICDTGLTQFYHTYYFNGNCNNIQVKNNTIRANVSKPYPYVYNFYSHTSPQGTYYIRYNVDGDDVEGNFQNWTGGWDWTAVYSNVRFKGTNTDYMDILHHLYNNVNLQINNCNLAFNKTNYLNVRTHSEYGVQVIINNSSIQLTNRVMGGAQYHNCYIRVINDSAYTNVQVLSNPTRLHNCYVRFEPYCQFIINISTEQAGNNYSIIGTTFDMNHAPTNANTLVNVTSSGSASGEIVGTIFNNVKTQNISNQFTTVGNVFNISS